MGYHDSKLQTWLQDPEAEQSHFQHQTWSRKREVQVEQCYKLKPCPHRHSQGLPYWRTPSTQGLLPLTYILHSRLTSSADVHPSLKAYFRWRISPLKAYLRWRTSSTQGLPHWPTSPRFQNIFKQLYQLGINFPNWCFLFKLPRSPFPKCIVLANTII